MTAAAHVVTVGALPGAALADPEGAVVAAALMEAGVPVASRVVLDEDEAALERALTPDDGLTVVIAGGGSAGDVARRVVARAVGARLVLNERFLAALEERYRRLDRPLPRRAERLALVPQGATTWPVDDGEPGWMLESGARALVVLARDGLPAALASLSRNASVLHSEHFGERRCRQRLSEKEPLHLGAAPVEQVGELLLRFHSFSYDAHVEALGHRDHCLNDRRIVLAANHVLNEHGRDLDRVDWKLFEVSE